MWYLQETTQTSTQHRISVSNSLAQCVKTSRLQVSSEPGHVDVDVVAED
jgi:hypothetical protein